MTPKVIFEDLGRVDYQKAWDYQALVQKSLIDQKQAFRAEYGDQYIARLKEAQRHKLIFCDHPHVYTMGSGGTLDHLLLDPKQMEEKGIQYFRIKRGGDITYHGPGQIVGYPIFDMDCFFNDVHQYVRFLEEAIIRTIAEFGLEGIRIKDYTGVWLDGPVKRKICAIGVHFSRWVTMHGFAFNVQTDLSYFNYIVPCGIREADKSVTSMERELGRPVDIEYVKTVLKRQLANVFQFEYIKEPASGKRLETRLPEAFIK